MVYGRLCILRVVVPCEETWPLEKVMIFHEVDFEQNKYEFYLDMLYTPRIWGYGVLLDVKEVVYELETDHVFVCSLCEELNYLELRES